MASNEELVVFVIEEEKNIANSAPCCLSVMSLGLLFETVLSIVFLLAGHASSSL